MRLAVAALLVLIISACTSRQEERPSQFSEAATAIAGEESPEPGTSAGGACMTMEDVRQEEDRCLVVVEEKVYDLTDSDVWGHDYLHSGELECGEDHTSALSEMPHSRSLFEPYLLTEIC